jgi:hypothetical protein
VISVIALVAALGGTGYAASRIVSPQASTSKVSKSTKKFVKKQVSAALTQDAASDATASVKHASTAERNQGFVTRSRLCSSSHWPTYGLD